MDNTKTKRLSTALVCFGMFCALLCAVEFLPGMEAAYTMSVLYLPVFIAAIPLVLTFVFIYSGYYIGAAVSVIGFAAAALLGFSAAVYMAAAFLPLVIVECIVIKGRKRLRTSVIASAAAAIVGAALVFVILMRSTGMSVVEYSTKVYTDMLSGLTDQDISFVYGAVRYNDLLTGAVTPEALEATSASDAVLRMQEIFREGLNASIVYLVIVYALTAGYAVYIIPRATAKKLGVEVPKLTKLKDYELPKKLWLAALAFGVAAYIADSFGMRGADVMMATIISVFAFVFMVQGFCVLLYFFEERKVRKGLRTVLLICALLFLRTIALPLVGIFENMFRIRQRSKLGKEQA